MTLPRKGFDYDCGTLTTADAGAPEAVPPAAPTQCMQEMEGNAGTTCAQWVANRDRPAVHIGAFAVQPQLLLYRKILRRERLVDLDQVHVL